MRVARLFGRVLKRGHRQQEGQAGFEFVLVLPFFILFFLLMVDLGVLMYSHVSVANSVREGARFGAVNCGDGACDPGEIEQRVVERSGGILADPAEVTVGWIDRNDPNTDNTNRSDSVVVKVTHPHSFVFFPSVTIDVESCADMRLEQTDGTSSATQGSDC